MKVNIELTEEDAKYLAAILTKAESMFDYAAVDNYFLHWKPVMSRIQNNLTAELEKPKKKEHWTDNLSEYDLYEMYKTC